MCCKINVNNFSINVKTLKRFNIILTFCVMYTVYGLFFCTSAEISGQKYYLLKRSVSDEINIISILHDKSSSIFSPRESICKYFSTSQHKKSFIIFKTTLTSAGVCVVFGVGTYIFSSLCRCNERKVPPNFAFTTNTTWLMTCRDAP